MIRESTTYKFSDIIQNFKIQEGDFKIGSFGSGHIKDTYHVAIATLPSAEYLLQRINHFVFKDVASLMSNMVRITGHLKNKFAAIPGSDPDKEVLTLIECKNGTYFHKDQAGNYWRMTRFLANTKSYDLVTSPDQAY